jgi:hypothetical protein
MSESRSNDGHNLQAMDQHIAAMSWREIADTDTWAAAAPAFRGKPVYYYWDDPTWLSTVVRPQARAGNTGAMQTLGCWHAQKGRFNANGYKKATKWWTRVALTETHLSRTATCCLWTLGYKNWRSSQSREHLEEVKKWLSHGVAIQDAESTYQYALFLRDFDGIDGRDERFRSLIFRARELGSTKAKSMILQKPHFWSRA